MQRIIPNLVSKYLILEGPEPHYYICLSVGLSVSVCLCVRLSVCLSLCLSVCPSLCLSVRLSVTLAVSGVREADEQQTTKFGPTYSVRHQ